MWCQCWWTPRTCVCSPRRGSPCPHSSVQCGTLPLMRCPMSTRYGVPHTHSPSVPASHPAHCQDTAAALLCPCPTTQIPQLPNLQVPMCVPPQRRPCSAEQGLCPTDPQSFPEMGAGSGPHAACRCLSWPACLRWGCVCCSCTRPWMATPRQGPPRACTCTAGTCPCASPRLCPCTSSQLLLMTSAWRTSTCRPASWGARACCR